MARDNKYNKHDPSIRGGAKVSDMKDKNRKYYKLARGRPARYKKLIAEAEAAEAEELEALKLEVEEKAKAEAEESKGKKSETDANKA